MMSYYNGLGHRERVDFDEFLGFQYVEGDQQVLKPCAYPLARQTRPVPCAVVGHLLQLLEK